MSFICGTDFGGNSTRATEIAARLAARAHQPLILVHALELPQRSHVSGGELVFLPLREQSVQNEELEKQSEWMLASEAKRLSQLSGATVIPGLTIGAPAAAILGRAVETTPSLIVSGTHGRSAPARWLVGSTADRLARLAVNPLLIVREPSIGLEAWSKGQKTLRVLVGVSFDDSFDCAANAAKSLASWGPCDLHFAYAHTSPSTLYGTSAFPLPPLTESDLRASTTRAVARMAKGRGLTVEDGHVRLLLGPPAAALVDEAKAAFDLIVVGTHGRRGLQRALLGSVALGVLHHAPCPVLIAPVL